MNISYVPPLLTAVAVAVFEGGFKVFRAGRVCNGSTVHLAGFGGHTRHDLRRRFMSSDYFIFPLVYEHFILKYNVISSQYLKGWQNLGYNFIYDVLCPIIISSFHWFMSTLSWNNIKSISQMKTQKGPEIIWTKGNTSYKTRSNVTEAKLDLDYIKKNSYIESQG